MNSDTVELIPTKRSSWRASATLPVADNVLARQMADEGALRGDTWRAAFVLTTRDMSGEGQASSNLNGQVHQTSGGLESGMDLGLSWFFWLGRVSRSCSWYVSFLGLDHSRSVCVAL